MISFSALEKWNRAEPGPAMLRKPSLKNSRRAIESSSVGQQHTKIQETVVKSGSITRYSPEAAKIVAKVLAAILGVELAIMVFFEWLAEPLLGRELPWWFVEFGDPFLLVVILAPIIYLWVALPLRDAQKEIHDMAYHDALTRLPNRRLLNDRINQAMAVSRRKGCFGALMALDLDNFKPLNDAHGHGIGDMLLVEVAKRLTTCVRENDTVARFGGDEFVVVLSELSTDRQEAITQAERVAEKIRLALAADYSLKVSKSGTPEVWIKHQCTASIGVAVFVQKDPDDIDLLKQADAAMYEAKDSGRNSIRFFNEASSA
jgi:diguanylate cyclase (GGDEF)-like protein